MEDIKYKIFADGACRGNPGTSSIGAVCFANTIPDLNEFKQRRDSVFIVSQRIGHKTNNEAEYMALEAALSRAIESGITSAEVFMDSELVVKQVNGIYKVKNPRLADLHLKVKKISAGKGFVFKHVPREKNSIADYLANLALDTMQDI